MCIDITVIWFSKFLWCVSIQRFSGSLNSSGAYRYNGYLVLKIPFHLVCIDTTVIWFSKFHSIWCVSIQRLSGSQNSDQFTVYPYRHSWCPVLPDVYRQDCYLVMTCFFLMCIFMILIQLKHAYPG